MTIEKCKISTTYGGEVELLVVDQEKGNLISIDASMEAAIQNDVNRLAGSQVSSESSIVIGYDCATHLVEIGAGIHDNLIGVTSKLITTINKLQEVLAEEKKGTLLSLSYHPLEKHNVAYQRVVNRPIYKLIRGGYGEQSNTHPSVLQKIYPTDSEQGRKWKHSVGVLAASIQPWNSLDFNNACHQIAVLQATGWLFNLLTANSPIAEGRIQEKRDYRLEMWGKNGLLSTSRYPSDKKLTQNLPHKPTELVHYYHFILTHQRPLVIPLIEGESNSQQQYKMRFMAVVQPDDKEKLTALDYLSSGKIHVVDIETGEEREIIPSVGHIFNGFDFLYFPQFGARLRVKLPLADAIDPLLFAEAVRKQDEVLFQKLLLQGGIDNGGFICAEGRVPATVLPTRTVPTWQRFCIPFVLQTAIVRSYKEVQRYLQSTGLSWYDLTYTLPHMANNREQGFNTVIHGMALTDLAIDIWSIVKESLTLEEQLLVGKTIDKILESRKAPSEEAIEFLSRLMQSQSTDSAIASLIYTNNMLGGVKI